MHWKSFTTFLIASHQILKSRPSTAFVLRTTRRFSAQSCFHQSSQIDEHSLSGHLKLSKRSYSSTPPINMPRGVKKENLPSKVCVVCARPFTWRKKWERVWDEVTTCSKSCNHKRRVANRQQKGKETDGGVDIDNVSSINEGLSTSPMDFQEVSRRSMSNKAETEVGDADAECTVVSANSSVELTSDEALSPEILDELDDANEAIESLIMEHDSMEDIDDPAAFAKKQRKALKKAKKAERRAQRQGCGDPSAGQKTCDMCGKSVNLLIRCMYEPGQIDWKMVCGKCWKIASGGVVDGDENHPHYRYGGLWKNRRIQF